MDGFGLVYIGISVFEVQKPEMGPSLNFSGFLHTLVRTWIADSAMLRSLGAKDIVGAALVYQLTGIRGFSRLVESYLVGIWILGRV